MKKCLAASVFAGTHMVYMKWAVGQPSTGLIGILSDPARALLRLGWRS